MVEDKKVVAVQKPQAKAWRLLAWVVGVGYCLSVTSMKKSRMRRGATADRRRAIAIA
jgi:hypothetical protein